jgi:maltooligosyltrehalose trehalohydrolase
MSELAWRPRLGAWLEEGRTRFRVWAPDRARVEVRVTSAAAGETTTTLVAGEAGYFETALDGLAPGDRYQYLLDGQGPFPDPVSRYQPEGVHGPSMLVDPGAFAWSDHDWRGVAPDTLVIYELHVGTFTPTGTFRAAIDRLPHLRDLGITAIELMPVADFPGQRNWGYDGVALFAPARCYGTPDDLRALVDAAHAAGLAVLLDVVYNHVGPDGAYLFTYSPWYFTDLRPSPWGKGVNLDGPFSDEVRAFIVENALHWVHEYHVDGLRLDATHAMHDDGPRHFLAELAARVHAAAAPRQVAVIAEDHRNLAAMVTPEDAGGWGLDGVWADDLHHQVRRALAGDSDGYYADFSGRTADIATTVRQGWFFTGQVSSYLSEPRGTDPAGVPARHFVVCLQNHDQIGNRAFGTRLHDEVPLAAVRAATTLLLTAPQTPLLFMGQEWAATSPFLYFTDHHAELGRLITEGRRHEFSRFAAFHDVDLRQRIPDPQALQTFEASRLAWDERSLQPHAGMLRLHQALLRLRANTPALHGSAGGVRIAEALDEDTLVVVRTAGPATVVVVVRLRGAGAADLAPTLAPLDTAAAAPWQVVLSSEDPAFTPDPAPVTVAVSPGGPRLTFQRPSAIILSRTAQE